ncbi:MAG: hypothetical protein D6680_21565 [Cyanobacteria bacterium J007]|nr:MAG: hypothetical protein D6680_21565 [Cyanobacteria bacterium J007]
MQLIPIFWLESALDLYLAGLGYENRPIAETIGKFYRSRDRRERGLNVRKMRLAPAPLLDFVMRSLKRKFYPT